MLLVASYLVGRIAAPLYWFDCFMLSVCVSLSPSVCSCVWFAYRKTYFGCQLVPATHPAPEAELDQNGKQGCPLP
jgi:hypothetical protein